MNNATSEVREFSIQGMSCSGCASRIERTLGSNQDIEQVAVNFANKTATVRTPLEPVLVAQLINKLGFKAELITRGLSLEERHRAEHLAAGRRLVLALVLGVPVIAAGMVHEWSSIAWVLALEAALTFALLLGPAREFFIKAAKLLMQRTANMDTLVSLGAGFTFIWSCVQMIRGSGYVYFETAAAIVTFVLVGKYIEHRMVWRATSSLGALMQLQPVTALRVSRADSTVLESVDLRFVRAEDRLVCRAGERFAADGVIVEGRTETDESLLTGESLPVAKNVGDSVVAGSLNISGAVTYGVGAVGAQTRLGEIISFVERTQLSKAPIQRLADRASAIFVPVILALSVITFLLWNFIINAELADSMNAAVSVLVVACPCALGLATPIAVMIATGRAARAGILFRDLAALESLQSVRTIVFDKTGTLTTGQLSVAEEKWLVDEQFLPLSKDVLTDVVFHLEQRSQHPAAVALTKYMQQKKNDGVQPQALTDIREIAGEGIRALWSSPTGNKQIRIGRPSQQDKAGLPSVADASQVVCSVDDKVCVLWLLKDSPRTDAAEVIRGLRQMNVQSILASGDHTNAVAALAADLGIEFHGEQTPQMKAELIDRLKADGRVIAMLGDGINDAPALAAADVGIAMGSGTDAARQTAALTLKDSGLSGVLSALRLSYLTFRNIRQNLFWAFGYNVLLIPLAMMGRLTPMWAAAAMVLSSLLVVLNALRILRFDSPASV
ncbi:MAG: hypothetical protein RL189_2923 [Pseudomonadota bacterium]|jgi:Cu+-exporting ATPase